MSGPNISQYFANTVDSTNSSFFEGISQTPTTDSPSTSTAAATAAADPPIPDDVRDQWEPSHPAAEPGRPPLLTTPGVQLATDLADPIRLAVQPLLGDAEAQRRHVLTADDVTQDERGLRQLIAAGAFRSAVNLTGRLLTIYGQGYGRLGQPAKHSPHSLQLWYTRFALLRKLGMFELCQAEAEPFGQLNRPDVYFEFSPEMHGTRRGSMAPFSLRLLLAELPMYTVTSGTSAGPASGGATAGAAGAAGGAKMALDRLTEMYLVCRQIVEFYAPASSAAYEFWRAREQRIVHALVNCALQMRDYNMTDTLIAQLADGGRALAPGEKKALYSAWGRIYLQCGDVFGAERKFSEARRIRDGSTLSELRDIIDKGLIAVAQNDFQTAQVAFENALKLEPSNAMLLNNLGVCSLYAGRLKEAIRFFELAVQQAGQRNGLNDGMLLNLSTLYELESSNDVTKKLDLLRQINVLPADVNVNLEFCLKLQPVNKIY